MVGEEGRLLYFGSSRVHKEPGPQDAAVELVPLTPEQERLELHTKDHFPKAWCSGDAAFSSPAIPFHLSYTHHALRAIRCFVIVSWVYP